MELHATGMGGQGPIAIYDAKAKQVKMLHGYGEAPMAATIDLIPIVPQLSKFCLLPCRPTWLRGVN